MSLGLAHNATLKRLTLASTGLTSRGVIPLLGALTGHESLQTLDLGQSFATEDLDARFNWISDPAAETVVAFIQRTPNLRYFGIDYNAFSYTALNQIHELAILGPDSNDNLCWFEARNIVQPNNKASTVAATIYNKIKKKVKVRLHEKVANLYDGMTYEEFNVKEKRKLLTPEESVRKIDSVYRNRDADMAKRGLKFLKKTWMEGDGTLEVVMAS